MNLMNAKNLLWTRVSSKLKEPRNPVEPFKPQENSPNLETSTGTSVPEVSNVTVLNDGWSDLLGVHGRVNSHKALILLDSGSTHDFVPEDFVREHHLESQTGDDVYTITLADGIPDVQLNFISGQQAHHALRRRDQGFLAYVTTDGSSSRSQNELELQSMIRASPGVVRRDRLLYLLNEYQDVFPNNIIKYKTLPAKLPPVRQVNHEIDLETGSKPSSATSVTGVASN